MSLSDAGFDDLQACADPGAPEHGYKTPSAGVFFESVVVRFHCQEGYRLNGTSKKLCVRHFNGSLSWKPSDKPVCLQEGKSVFFKLFPMSVLLTCPRTMSVCLWTKHKRLESISLCLIGYIL